MKMKTNDPAVKQGFLDIVHSTHSMESLAMLRSAEKTVIAYYFDMMSAMTVHRIKKNSELDLPDCAPVKKAVTEINRACANLKRPFLFEGSIQDPVDLFAFASGIAMPTAA